MSNRRNPKGSNWNAGQNNRRVDNDRSGQIPPRDPPTGNGGVGGGDGKGQGGETGTQAEQTIARFTGVLACVAIIQASVTVLQLHISQRALFDSETPNIKLWVDDLTGVDSGLTIEARAHIRNTGTNTLFNGRRFTAINLLPKANPEAIWNEMLPDKDHIVMGPEDEEITNIHWRRLTPAGYAALKSGQIAITIAQKMDFPDAAGRLHHRYICAYWWYNAGHMIPETCSTPPQS